MTDQITFERLRDLYSWMTAWRADVPAGRDDLQNLRDTQRAEFDAVMAAHDERVRAEERARIAMDALDVTVSLRQRSGVMVEYIEASWLREALTSAGEPQWEYGVAMFGDMNDVEHDRENPWRSIAEAHKHVDDSFNDFVVRRRTFAPGSWEPLSAERPEARSRDES